MSKSKSKEKKLADEKPKSVKSNKGYDLDRAESPDSKKRLSPSKN